ERQGMWSAISSFYFRVAGCVSHCASALANGDYVPLPGNCRFMGPRPAVFVKRTSGAGGSFLCQGHYQTAGTSHDAGNGGTTGTFRGGNLGANNQTLARWDFGTNAGRATRI